MNFIIGIALLLIYQIIGEFIVSLLGLRISGSIIGMILLFCSFLINKNIATSVDVAATSLLKHLSLLFIPAGVGVINYFNLIASEWLPIILVLLASTIITMVATVAIMTGADYLLTKKHSND